LLALIKTLIVIGYGICYLTFFSLIFFIKGIFFPSNKIV